MKYFGSSFLGQTIGVVALAALMQCGPIEATARQYVSLAPNYSALQNNAELDYWTFDHREDNPKKISNLWDMPNAGMFTEAHFDCCITNYSKSDKKISYVPSFTLGDADFDGVDGRMELILSTDADGRSPWLISRVEIYAVNAFDPNWNYNPRFTINGIEARLPEAPTRDYCGVDLPMNGEPVTKLIFETPPGNRISFWDMKIYLYGAPQLENGYEWEGVTDYGCGQLLHAPVVKIGTLDPAATGRLQCSVLDASGEIVASSTDAAEGEFLLDISALEEGRYSVCYHIPDPTIETHIERCFPDPEDGLPLEIRPSLDGVTINGVALATPSDGTSLQIPTAIEGDSTGWAHATLGGLREGVTVYWHCSASDAHLYSATPEGYTLYDPATGINLENNSRLHLILEKNGVSSQETVISYDRPSVEVSVETVLQEESVTTEWYTIDGRRTDPDRARRGEILLRRSASPKGAATTEKLMQ
ncbi:MAG: hypothetical protein K2G78_01860 [Muribaculaceae bacterium]|nr:hypothetical protein [Muribaculaceae bacterium]